MTLEFFANLTLIFSIAYTWHSYRKNDQSYIAAHEKTVNSYNRLISREQAFFNQLSLLEENSTRYFQTLNEAGLSEALKIRDQLIMANQDIVNFIDSGNYEAAQALITFLENPTTKPFPWLLTITTAKLNSLYNWKDRANQHITSCVIKLGIVTSQITANQEQESKRRKTIHSLEQLREVMNRNRHQSDRVVDW